MAHRDHELRQKSNPLAELGAGDANMNKGKNNFMNAQAIAGQAGGNNGGLDTLLSGDPLARIQEALGKVNGQG